MKIKEVKRNRKKKRRLLAFMCVLMIAAFGMFIVCAVKTFLLALMGATTAVMIGAACSLAALVMAARMETLIKEVNRDVVGVRPMETVRRHRGAA